MKNWKALLLVSCMVSFYMMNAQNKYGYINQKNEVVIPAKFDRAGNFENGLAAVKINGLWGFINTKGEIVIAPKYKTVIGFYGTIGKVSLAEVDFFDQNANYLYINQKGEEIPENSVLGNPVYFDGLKRVKTIDGKFGFKNNKGTLIIPTIYDDARDFNNHGWTVCTKNRLMGCINTKGEIIIPFELDWIDYNFGQYISVQTRNGENRIYNTKGTYITVSGVDKIYPFSKEGIAAFTLNGKTGFMDTNGKILVSARFDDSGSSILEGLVKVISNGQLQVLDILNDTVLCTIPNAKGYEGFSGGLSRIEINKKYGFIDKNGKTIIPVQHLDLGISFKEGLTYFAETPRAEPKIERTETVASKPYTNSASTVYTSGNISTSSYALDIFKEQGSMAIFRGSTMYVVKVTGRKKQDVNITAAQANQILGFTGEFKFQWFPGNNCTTLKSKYSAVFSVICQGELDLDK